MPLFPMQLKLIAQNCSSHGDILLPQLLPILSGKDWVEATTTSTLTNAGMATATFSTQAAVDYVIPENSRVQAVVKWKRFKNPDQCKIDGVQAEVKYFDGTEWKDIIPPTGLLTLWEGFAQRDGHSIVNLGTTTAAFEIGGNPLEFVISVGFHSTVAGTEVGVRLEFRKEKEDTYLLLPLSGL